MSEDQPLVAVPSNPCINAYSIIIKLPPLITMPNNKITLIGAIENDVIPSKAKATILRNGYFETPAKRGWR